MSTQLPPRPGEIGNHSSLAAGNDIRAGQKAFDAGRFHEALFYLDRATSADEANAEAWYRKGNCLHVLKRDLEAVRCYDRALKYDPRAALAWRNRGFCLMQSERLEEALRSYERVLGINARDTWVRKAKQATEEKILLGSQLSLSRFTRATTPVTGLRPGVRPGNA